MGKSKMDDAAAERIRRARGDKVRHYNPFFPPSPIRFGLYMKFPIPLRTGILSFLTSHRMASPNARQKRRGGTCRAVAAAVIRVICLSLLSHRSPPSLKVAATAAAMSTAGS